MDVLTVVTSNLYAYSFEPILQKARVDFGCYGQHLNFLFPARLKNVSANIYFCHVKIISVTTKFSSSLQSSCHYIKSVRTQSLALHENADV